MSLSFIKDEDLERICLTVIDSLSSANAGVKNFHRNIIDPFSAVFESMFYSCSLSEWIPREQSRQVQKSFQNSIGRFHQQIIGSCNGWNDLGVGNIIDLVNNKKKMFAEIKNKHNTTKGNHKTAIYDDLEAMLRKSEYKEYTGYYVTIIAKTKFNRPFIPSDNKL